MYKLELETSVTKFWGYGHLGGAYNWANQEDFFPICCLTLV